LKNRLTNTELINSTLSGFKLVHIDRSEKLQTQLSTGALIVFLIGCSIVLYLCHTISEISHQFFRRSKITKTIEIYHVIVSLCVRYPMSTRTSHIVQVYDTTRDAYLLSVMHKNTSKICYMHVSCQLTQLFVVTPAFLMFIFFFVITPCPCLYGPRYNPFPYLYGARYCYVQTPRFFL